MEPRNEDYGIVLEVLAGDRNAYAEIVRKYEQRVRGYCRTMLSELASAEDAAQEIFMKAYQGLENFHGSASFSTWLYRITLNHCTDLLRKRACRKEESWEKLLEDQGDRIEKLLAVQPETVPDQERNEFVERFLSLLPEKSRQILILRELQGLSYQEIAAVLQCTLDAVKARLKRARQEVELKLRHFPARKNV